MFSRRFYVDNMIYAKLHLTVKVLLYTKLNKIKNDKILSLFYLIDQKRNNCSLLRCNCNNLFYNK